MASHGEFLRFKFHQSLVKRKYRLLFSSKTYRKPGPKGPSKELIQLIIEMKQNLSLFYFNVSMVYLSENNSFIRNDSQIKRREEKANGKISKLSLQLHYSR